MVYGGGGGGRSQSYGLDLHIFVCTITSIVEEAEAQNAPSWAEAVVKIPFSGNLKH